jgi:hypothetical protein
VLALGKEPQALEGVIAQIQTHRRQRPVPIRPLKRDNGVRPLKRSNGETRLTAEAKNKLTAQSIPSPIQLLRYFIGSLNDISPAATPPIPYWSAKRYLTCGNPAPGPSWSQKSIPWRSPAPRKLKTANAALVLCRNIDVDSPDIIKTNPCAI